MGALAKFELSDYDPHFLTTMVERVSISKDDFRHWSEAKGQELPSFWFGKPPAPESRAQVKIAGLRRGVQKWIEKTASEEDPERFTKGDFLACAREHFAENVTENLFNEAWRGADIPAGFKKQGRRPGR